MQWMLEKATFLERLVYGTLTQVITVLLEFIDFYFTEGYSSPPQLIQNISTEREDSFILKDARILLPSA